MCQVLPSQPRKTAAALAWAAAIGLSGMVPTSLAGQDLQSQSRAIGGIERGFWTRSLSNDLRIEAGDLVIRRTHRTIVDWTEPGVPGRSVTDTQVWRLPLAKITGAKITLAPGAQLLQGDDQDSYCPLAIARFSCSGDHGDCGAGPQFAVCRYNLDDLAVLLAALQTEAPNLTITLPD